MATENEPGLGPRPRKVGVYDRPAPRSRWPLILLLVAILVLVGLFAAGAF